MTTDSNLIAVCRYLPEHISILPLPRTAMWRPPGYGVVTEREELLVAHLLEQTLSDDEFMIYRNNLRGLVYSCGVADRGFITASAENKFKAFLKMKEL